MIKEQAGKNIATSLKSNGLQQSSQNFTGRVQN